jgi:predicted DNA-binding WGR domain protein
LTKVDLKNGIYGDYVFYKMQMLFDSNRDLYVVFTRWGRIGEVGMNQRTPFNNLEEAKKEFKSIFKNKTGGNNFEELD